VGVLLDADSLFPHDFHLFGIEKSKNTSPLLKKVEDRHSFHQAMKGGLQNDVKAFIESHPRLKEAYDPSNKSALMTALKAGQYELYALLQSEGFSADEEVTEVVEMLTSEQTQRLRNAKLKYFGRPDDSRIIYVLSKSMLGFGQKNNKNFGKVRELYKELCSIPEISTTLEVVEFSALTEIIFDFDDSFVDLEPTRLSGIEGSCYYIGNHIYIGAKEGSKLLVTLAHELTHLSMQVSYDNDCKPDEISVSKQSQKLVK